MVQERGCEAVEFSVGMQFPGYNLYALGSAETDKCGLVLDRARSLAQSEDTPDDWCYLQNFEDPARPNCARLPAGHGRRIRREMQDFINNVRAMAPPALTSDDYQR